MSSQFILQAIDSKAAGAAYTEMTKFVDLRSPDVVNKQLNKVLSFDAFLNATNLPKTHELVTNFLQVCVVLRSPCRIDPPT